MLQVEVQDKKPSFKWGPTDSNNFRAKLMNESVKNEINDLLRNSKSNPTKMAQAIKNILIQTSLSINVKQNKKNSQNQGEVWFDKECTKAKNDVLHWGRLLKKNPGNPEIRTELFQKKRNYRKVIKLKKRA